MRFGESDWYKLRGLVTCDPFSVGSVACDPLSAEFSSLMLADCVVKVLCAVEIWVVFVAEVEWVYRVTRIGALIP